MRQMNFGSRVVNNYLLPIEDGYLLVDTGYPNGFRRFKKKLDRRGIALGDIRHVLLTHAHRDHAGFLDDILKNTSADILMHPIAAERLAKGTQGEDALPVGVTGRILTFLMSRMERRGVHRPGLADPNRIILLDAKTRERVGREMHCTLVPLPGHTAGSVGLYSDDGTLYCGDAAMNGLLGRHRISILIEDVDDYLASWHTILALNPTRIYPGHGRDFPAADLRENLGRVERLG